MVCAIETCRVKAVWGMLRVRRSHPQLYAGQATYVLVGGYKGKPPARALLVSLEAGQCMPTACSLAEREHLGKPGTRSELFPLEVLL